MEQYSSSQCGAAVQSFVSGWSATIDNGAGQDGVYGSPSNAQNDWQGDTDNVWIAKTGTNSASSPSVTIWGLSPLLDMYWNTYTGSRIHQYLGNQSVTWGGLNITIDEDIEDAPIVAGSGVKTYSNFTVNGTFIGDDLTFNYGINDEGNLAGAYVDSSGVEHGFEDTPSGPVTIDYPGATETVATGLNNLGQVVGAYNTPESGFLYTGPGQFTSVNCPAPVCPGIRDSYPTGINDAGWIVGDWDAANNPGSGFLYKGGQYQLISHPGAVYTNVNGINGDGHIVGEWLDGNGIGHGYIYYKGSFQKQIDAPGGTGTVLCGINNNGQILGASGDTSVFLYDENSGLFTTLPSSSEGYEVTSLNDLMQIAGIAFYASPGQASSSASYLSSIPRAPFNPDRHHIRTTQFAKLPTDVQSMTTSTTFYSMCGDSHF